MYIFIVIYDIFINSVFKQRTYILLVINKYVLSNECVITLLLKKIFLDRLYNIRSITKNERVNHKYYE